MDKVKIKKIEYLNQYRCIDSRIRILKERLENHKQDLYTISAVQFDGMPKNGESRTIGDRVVDVLSLEEETLEKIKNLALRQSEIRNKIEKITDFECLTVLELYYIDNLYWKEVADAMGISERKVYNIHCNAIDKFEM